MICDRCGEDRVREDARILAFLRAGWPPVRFARVCPSCREELRWSGLNRALFLLCCLTLLGAIAASGVGLVHLVRWLLRTPP